MKKSLYLLLLLLFPIGLQAQSEVIVLHLSLIHISEPTRH